jgi:hypothetical protein
MGLSTSEEGVFEQFVHSWALFRILVQAESEKVFKLLRTILWQFKFLFNDLRKYFS